jgi:hypothetical protein
MTKRIHVFRASEAELRMNGFFARGAGSIGLGSNRVIA